MEIKDIITNKNVQTTMFNLYLRWLDEKQFEDIDDYAKALNEVLKNNNIDVEDVIAHKRPFSFTFIFEGYAHKIAFRIKGNKATMKYESKVPVVRGEFMR